MSFDFNSTKPLTTLSEISQCLTTWSQKIPNLKIYKINKGFIIKRLSDSNDDTTEIFLDPSGVHEFNSHKKIYRLQLTGYTFKFKRVHFHAHCESTSEINSKTICATAFLWDQ